MYHITVINNQAEQTKFSWENHNCPPEHIGVFQHMMAVGKKWMRIIDSQQNVLYEIKPKNIER